jgi:hypothetical protein
MRKIFLMSIIVGFLINCSKDLSPTVSVNKYREIAWNSLSDMQKATVITDWKEAHTESCLYWENKRRVICVFFNTTEDALLGPIVVYIDPKSLEVIGFQPRY